jgi:flagellin-like hook-associated protein FlgL
MAINDISLTSGMRSNLLNLQLTSALQDRTQERLSSGKKVNSPIDNPLNFFLSKSFTDRAGDLSISKDNMATAIQTIKASDAAVKAISALVDAAKSIINSAKSSSVTTERTAFAAQYDSIVTQIGNISSTTGNDGVFNGTNLLNSATTTLTVDLGDGSTLTVTGFDATTAASGFAMTAIGTGWDGIAAANNTSITAAETSVNGAASKLRTGAQSLAANLSIVTVRQEFASNMINTLGKAADNLTLADMNEEGANMLMLQTRQSLGVTALSLSSQAAQSVLRLF